MGVWFEVEFSRVVYEWWWGMDLDVFYDEYFVYF